MKKIYLHVGLPKTATSAIQTLLFNNRQLLLDASILYPKEMLKKKPPKHQKLVKAFHQVNFVELANCLKRSNHDSIILSTEGITNHFYDFSEEAFDQFNELTDGFQLIIVFVKREINSWLKSYYTQAVFNPQSSKACYYGTQLNFDDFSCLERIQQISNFDQLKNDLIKKFNPKEFIELNHSTEIVSNFIMKLDLPNLIPVKEHVNFSPPKWTVELMRQINQMTTVEFERGYWKHIIKLLTDSKHTMLNKLSEKYIDTQTVIAQFNQLSPNSNHVYNLENNDILKVKNFLKSDRNHNYFRYNR